MCRPSSLIIIALFISLVSCKPLDTQNASEAQFANLAALLSDPKLMAAFAQFLQQKATQSSTVVEPQQSSSENQNASIEPQAGGAVAVTQPLETIIATPLIPTVVETVSPAQQIQIVAQQPAPAQAQPEATLAVIEPVTIQAQAPAASVTVVAQQPPAVQAQPQIQQVTTVTALQNAPTSTVVQPQQSQVIASQPLDLQVSPQTQPQAQAVVFQQTAPVEAPALAASAVVVEATQNPPTVDTRAPFPAEQPQAVAPAVQAQPQILNVQVTPQTQPQAQAVAQAVAPAVQAQPQILNVQVTPQTEPQAQEVVYQQTAPVQALAPTASVTVVAAEQPHAVAQQPPAVQVQPQIQQVTTTTAFQNALASALAQLQQQQSQVTASQPLNSQVAPQTQPQAQPVVFQQLATVQAQAQAASVAATQNPLTVDTRAPFLAEQPQAVAPAVQAQPQALNFQVTPQTQPQAQPVLFQQPAPVPSPNLAQAQVSSSFPQWPSQQVTNPQASSAFSLPNGPVQLTPQSQENVSTQQWGNVRITTRPRTYVPTPDPLTPEQQKKQAMSAKYQFSTYMDDNIGGSFMSRAEVRDGLKVNGQYGYDDGFVKRMVVYEADDLGFRIVSDIMNPSTKTGQLDGTARVQIVQDGTQVDYTITRKDIGDTKKVIV